MDKYLEKCINSVLTQTFKHIEIILINDGSTDLSASICDAYALNYSNVKVLHTENKGVSAARNMGLKVAKGDFITFLDADDYIDSRMYEKMYKRMIETNADIAVCARYIVENDKIIAKSFFLPQEKIFNPDMALKSMMLITDLDSAVWDKLIKRSLFIDNYFPINRKINEELIVMYNCIKKCNKVVHVGEALYYHNVANPSATRTKFNLKFLDTIDACDELISRCECEMPQLVTYACAFHTGACLNVLSRIVIDDINQYMEVACYLRNKLINNWKENIKNPNLKIKYKILLLMLLINIKLFSLTIYAYNKIKKVKDKWIKLQCLP